MKDQSLFVASMRNDFLQLGIGQVCLQLVLEDGPTFRRRRKFGKKSDVSRFRSIFPGFSFPQKKAQRSQPGEMAIKHFLQSRERLHSIRIANRRYQLVGQDQTIRGESPGKRKSVVKARVALLILECENDRERRSDNCQYRRRYRQEIPVRDLKEQGGAQRPGNQVTGLPSRPNEKVGDSIPSTYVHDSRVLGFRPQFPNRIVSSVSFVSTNTARSLAGSVSASISKQSLSWHERRSTLVLDQ